VNTARTVSDAKRAFYNAHTRPINSIYRRIVDELMVEMQLLTVNRHYVYNPIYALGIVTAFDRFMQGYRPEGDLNSIFNALCNCVGGDASKYRQDAARLQESLSNASWEQLGQAVVDGPVGEALKSVANNSTYKYTRLFGIGLYTLLEQVDGEAVKDKDKLATIVAKLTETLHLSGDRLEKDVELYRGNLDKMQQAQQALADTIAADRRRREQREQEKANAATHETATSEPNVNEEPPAS
jgi:photosystem II biogenesis protein Psp29